MQVSKDHKILFVGDVVLESKPQFSEPFNALFQSAKIKSCNFEAPISGFGQPIVKTGPLVSQNPKAGKWLIDLGFNLFSLANNHIYDYGKEALDATINSLPANEIIGAGDEEKAYAINIQIVEGIKYGFLSLGENGYGALNGDREYGHAWINSEAVPQIIKKNKETVDVLLVQVHAGVELLDVPIPEWKTRFKELIDYGADVIIGHHPHIVQGYEDYKGKKIFYSLGNFYFDYPSNHPQWNIGAVLTLDFKDKILNNFEINIIERVGDEIQLKEKSYSDEFLKKLNQKNSSEDYISYVNQKAVEDWDKHHKNYYAKPFNGLTNYSPIKLLKHLKRTFFNRDVDYSLLWHNQFIESNRWLVERAIRVKMGYSKNRIK